YAQLQRSQERHQAYLRSPSQSERSSERSPRAQVSKPRPSDACGTLRFRVLLRAPQWRPPNGSPRTPRIAAPGVRAGVAYPPSFDGPRGDFGPAADFCGALFQGGRASQVGCGWRFAGRVGVQRDLLAGNLEPGIVAG